MGLLLLGCMVNKVLAERPHAPQCVGLQHVIVATCLSQEPQCVMASIWLAHIKYNIYIYNIYIYHYISHISYIQYPYPNKMKCSCPHSLPKETSTPSRNVPRIGGVGDLEVTKTIQPSKQICQNPWRIHGAGIYTNIKGVYWWDPCYHI